MWFFDHHGTRWHGWPMMWLWIIAIAVAAWWLWRYAQRNDSGVPPEPGGSQQDPVDILQRRYAAGEIDDEQFERMRRRLANGDQNDGEQDSDKSSDFQN